MENQDIVFEKRLKILVGAFIFTMAFLVLNLASLMGVIPPNSYTAYAPASHQSIHEQIGLQELIGEINHRFEE